MNSLGKTEMRAEPKGGSPVTVIVIVVTAVLVIAGGIAVAVLTRPAFRQWQALHTWEEALIAVEEEDFDGLLDTLAPVVEAVMEAGREFGDGLQMLARFVYALGPVEPEDPNMLTMDFGQYCLYSLKREVGEEVMWEFTDISNYEVKDFMFQKGEEDAPDTAVMQLHFSAVVDQVRYEDDIQIKFRYVKNAGWRIRDIDGTLQWLDGLEELLDLWSEYEDVLDADALESALDILSMWVEDDWW